MSGVPGRGPPDALPPAPGRLGRRGFLRGMGRAGATLLGAPAALDLFARLLPGAAAAPGELREVELYDRLPDRKVRCHVCPLLCVLSPGETCFCRTRTNRDGTLYSQAFANPCIVRIDPVEKLPLHHFLPGTETLSLAVGGCNLRCLYCQNWQQSQERPERLKTIPMSAAEAASGAARKQVAAVAHTYTEPVAFLEYVHAVADEARGRGLRSVVATAAYITPEALKPLCRRTDAFAVALKGFDETFYRKVCGVELKPVLDALVTIREEKVWLEVVTLLVPTLNDAPRETAALARWIVKNLGSDVPLHFSRFVPEYRLRDLPRTPTAVMEAARKAALDAGLRHVYLNNLSPHEGNHTFCPRCRTAVIERLGFKVLARNLEGGRCGRCRAALPGVWA